MRAEVQLKQSQILTLTPQMRQALKLLQTPIMELEQVLRTELLVNPLLEEVLEEETEEDEPESDSDEEETPAEVESGDPDDGGNDQVDWSEFDDDEFSAGYRSFEETPLRTETVIIEKGDITEHLLSQLRLLGLKPPQVEIGEYIIGNLDSAGYLILTVEEIAVEFGLETIVIERVLSRVQAFDPPGIAARDLRECLLIQMDYFGLDHPLAETLIRDHFDDLSKRRYLKIAEDQSCSVEEVQSAAYEIAHFSPKPALNYVDENAVRNHSDSASDPNVIIPDLIVEKVDGEYRVFLNDRYLPRLRVSQAYRNLSANTAQGGKQTMKFINEKRKSAEWLLRAIEERKQTMVRVMEFIVEVQEEFFEKGIKYLKPMNLRDVAERVEVHQSTVSRATKDKYVQTPSGIFELKFFFGTSLGTSNGTEINTKSVKDRVAHMVAEENNRKPLSDHEIVSLLEREGIKIARRTVAKYREELGILPARMRRKY
ncbi:RNA polymerase factor sigma-54 [candidate division KSB1 bacterium]